MEKEKVWSDKERLEAIQRTQKEMHAFDHVNVGALVSQATETGLRARFAFYSALRAIIKENHSLRERVAIEWNSRIVDHVKACDACQKMLGETIRQLSLEYQEKGGGE